MNPLDDAAVDKIITDFQAAECKDKDELRDEILNNYGIKTQDSLIAFCFVLKQIGFTPDDMISQLFYNECSKKLREYGHDFSAKISAFYWTFPRGLEKIADTVYRCVQRSRDRSTPLSLSRDIIYGANIPKEKKEEAVAYLKREHRI